MQDLKSGGGKEIGILMDTIFKMSLFWGEVSLGHGTAGAGGGGGISPRRLRSQGFVKMQIVGPFLLQRSNFGEFDLINY